VRTRQFKGAFFSYIKKSTKSFCKKKHFKTLHSCLCIQIFYMWRENNKCSSTRFVSIFYFYLSIDRTWVLVLLMWWI